MLLLRRTKIVYHATYYAYPIICRTKLNTEPRKQKQNFKNFEHFLVINLKSKYEQTTELRLKTVLVIYCTVKMKTEEFVQQIEKLKAKRLLNYFIYLLRI